MKKIILVVTLVVGICLTGCSTEANRVSYNLSQQADNFNDIRQITVINCLQGRRPIPNDWENVDYCGHHR